MVAFQFARGNLEARYLRLLAFSNVLEKSVVGTEAQGKSIYAGLCILGEATVTWCSQSFYQCKISLGHLVLIISLEFWTMLIILIHKTNLRLQLAITHLPLKWRIIVG